MIVFFITNPSYEKSLEAKYFYEVGDFKQAYNLAKEAFELDPYNKMATTIMTQSQFSLRYVRYNEEAKKYIHQIELLVNKEQITPEDKAKIRTITQIMIDSYTKLAPSVVVDPALIEEAKKYYQQFQRVHEKAY